MVTPTINKWYQVLGLKTLALRKYQELACFWALFKEGINVVTLDEFFNI
jgi:hypothetical protein